MCSEWHRHGIAMVFPYMAMPQGSISTHVVTFIISFLLSSVVANHPNSSNHMHSDIVYIWMVIKPSQNRSLYMLCNFWWDKVILTRVSSSGG